MFPIDPILVTTALVSLGVGYSIGVLASRRTRTIHAIQPNPIPPNTNKNSNVGVGANSQESILVKTSAGKSILDEILVQKLQRGNSTRTIMIEVEVPEKIRIPMEKLPELIKLTEPRTRIEERADRILPNIKQGLQEHVKGKEDVGTVSFMEHMDKPWLDIVSKVSGLEFSIDGRKVYCPEHGWQPYIVTSDGRILCGYDYHTLFDPNKPRTYPIRRLQKMQAEISRLEEEIETLRNIAQMNPIPVKQKRKKQGEYEDTIEHEPEEEYEEPVEENEEEGEEEE